MLPLAGSITDQGYTDEEWKLVNETRKILDRPDLAVHATCLRVPVEVGLYAVPLALVAYAVLGSSPQLIVGPNHGVVMNLPPGYSDPRPAVVKVHGGPEGQARPAFDPVVHAARPHPGQGVSAARLLDLLVGSDIRESHRECGRVQDAYSLRCSPQVHGAARDTVDHAHTSAATTDLAGYAPGCDRLREPATGRRREAVPDRRPGRLPPGRQRSGPAAEARGRAPAPVPCHRRPRLPA